MISAAVSPTAVPPDGSSPEEQWQSSNSTRKSRPARACTARSSARLLAVSPAPERRPAVGGVVTRREKEEQQQTSRIITPLTQPPAPAQLPRWTLRSMWELASLLNFLNVFRPLLNIVAEFSAEELETALISPNSTLDDVHIPLLRAIPPVTRMALGRATWVTVLCRKLKDWWHWVADGDIPLVASHGAEVEIYKNLEPATRVLILKALCDIRVEQEDIRNYIDNSLKHGIHLSAFRKERIGGDSHGVSYWYEDDPVVGHRLYREIRNIEVKKTKGKALPALPNASYQWEMLASNLDEFQVVSDKLLDSKNRTEVSLAKKLKIDVLPEVDKIQKRKDRLLKKQHRQALLLDSFVTADGISSGRSLRDRKPVTYTFDDYDKSINEAIKITKKRPNSPDLIVKREPASKPESNGEPNGTAQVTPEDPQHVSYDAQSPNQSEYDETDDEFHTGPLDRSNRRRKRPQRYSDKEFVEAITDNEADFDSDDIVGEAVYDDEYLRSRKQKVSSSSEGDEEYRWEDNAEDEEEDEEEDSLSISEDSDEHPQYKKLRGRSRRRGTKLRSVDELQAGLRRSRRSTRPRINYKQYELSDTDMESEKADKSNESDAGSDTMSDLQLSSASHDSQEEEDDEEMNDVKVNQEQNVETISEAPQCQPVVKTDTPGQACAGPQKRRFLDLNELAPGTGFEDGPNTIMKNEDDNT